MLPAAEIKARAAAMYSAVPEASPSATVVVIGPQWDDDVAPREMYLARDAVRSAAASAGVLFVDALQEGWLFEHPELIGADGVHPNNSGHAYLASLIGPLRPRRAAGRRRRLSPSASGPAVAAGSVQGDHPVDHFHPGAAQVGRLAVTRPRRRCRVPR